MENQNFLSLSKKFAPVQDLILEGNDEMKMLTSRVRSDYITFPYCIASCNFFLKDGDNCIPAEIGITKYSMSEGIVDQYHSLIDPSETIPMRKSEFCLSFVFILNWYSSIADNLPDVIEYSAEHHLIPYDSSSFPDLQSVLQNVYTLTHTYDVDGQKTAYIFAEFDEMEEISGAFKWFEMMSINLKMNLTWCVNFISLRTLFKFLLSHIPLTNLDDSDAFFAFKSGKFDYTDLCSFHLYMQNSRHCAISKAFIYCYILSDKFAKLFGVAELKSIKDPSSSSMKYAKPLIN